MLDLKKSKIIVPRYLQTVWGLFYPRISSLNSSWLNQLKQEKAYCPHNFKTTFLLWEQESHLIIAKEWWICPVHLLPVFLLFIWLPQLHFLFYFCLLNLISISISLVFFPTEFFYSSPWGIIVLWQSKESFAFFFGYKTSSSHSTLTF